MDSVVERVWSIAEALYAKLKRLPTQDEIKAAAIKAGVDQYEANNRARSWLIFMKMFTKIKE